MAEKILQFRQHRRWSPGLRLSRIVLVEPTIDEHAAASWREFEPGWDGHLYVCFEGTLDELSSVTDPEMRELSPKRGTKKGRDQFGDRFSVWRQHRTAQDSPGVRYLSRHLGRAAPDLESLIARAPKRWAKACQEVDAVLARIAQQAD